MKSLKIRVVNLDGSPDQTLLHCVAPAVGDEVEVDNGAVFVVRRRRLPHAGTDSHDVTVWVDGGRRS